MQRLARDNVRRIFEEQEKLNYELEAKKKKLDYWSKELNKREALTELERQKLDEDKKKVICGCGIFKQSNFYFCCQEVLTFNLTCLPAGYNSW